MAEERPAPGVGAPDAAAEEARRQQEEAQRRQEEEARRSTRRGAGPALPALGILGIIALLVAIFAIFQPRAKEPPTREEIVSGLEIPDVDEITTTAQAAAKTAAEEAADKKVGELEGQIKALRAEINKLKPTPPPVAPPVTTLPVTTPVVTSTPGTEVVGMTGTWGIKGDPVFLKDGYLHLHKRLLRTGGVGPVYVGGAPVFWRTDRESVSARGLVFEEAGEYLRIKLTGDLLSKEWDAVQFTADGQILYAELTGVISPFIQQKREGGIIFISPDKVFGK